METVVEPVVAPPAESTPAAATGVTAPPAEGSVAAPPAASIEDNVGFKQLRSQYETTKAELDRWKTLGDPDEAHNAHDVFAPHLTNALKMGQALGYTADQVREAMKQDLPKTLAYLQQEYAKPPAESHEAIDKRVQSIVDEKVKPLQQRFDETLNREAQGRYEMERDRLYKTEFADGLPDDNKEELFEIFDALFTRDAEALRRLKFENQTSDVAKHLAQAKVIFMKRHNSYIAHERGKAVPPPKPGQQTPPADDSGKFAGRKLSSKFGGGTVKDFIANL